MAYLCKAHAAHLIDHLTLSTHGKPQLRSTTSMTATATAALPISS